MWVNLVSLSSECNGECSSIVTNWINCTGHLAIYGWLWISYVWLTRHTQHSQQLCHFWSNVGQLSVIVFRMQCWMLWCSQKLSKLHWSSRHIRLTLSFLYSAYKTHKILNSFVIFGPIWADLVSLSSACNGECCGIVKNCLTCTGHLAIYGWLWIS